MSDKNLPPIEAIFFRNWEASHIPEIFEEIYLREVYKPYLFGKKDLIIADVGANIGLFSYYAKDYAKEIFALEPNREHLEEMSKMLEFNNIKNVTVCPYGMSGNTKKVKLYHNPNTTAHSLSWINDPKDFEEIEVVSMDEFIARNKLDHIDLLKMDSEGEEAKIFASDGFKECADKIKVIVGEYHVWCGIEKDQFANILRDLGYQFNWIPNMKASVFTAVKL